MVQNSDSWNLASYCLICGIDLLAAWWLYILAAISALNVQTFNVILEWKDKMS